MKEAEENEAHIYSAVDQEHAYEVVTKAGGLKTYQQKKQPKKAKDEFDLKPCPAYAPVTAQSTQGVEYEVVSSK